MEVIKLYANAKINLSLDVVSRREDGYHELETVMSEVPLSDTIFLKKSDKISINCDAEFVPTDRRNIAYKCAVAFFEHCNINGGVEITIKKNIPVCAGLAGGSTDGASVLKGLNILYKTELTENELCTIGDKVGKDIPFCIKGGTCLATGTGNKLVLLKKLKNCYIVLVKPDNINVSTKDIFEKYDSSKVELHPYTNGIVDSLENEDIKSLSRMMYNVLENITASVYPIINTIKKDFLQKNSIGAVMSGSGPSVFGIFDNKEYAKEAYSYFHNQYNQVYFLDMNV